MLEFTNNKLDPYIINCHYVDQSICDVFSDFGQRHTKWYELELILWGEGYMVTDGKKYYPQKGDLFFRKPGTITHGIPPYYCYMIGYDMFYNDVKAGIYADYNWLFGDMENNIPGNSVEQHEDLLFLQLPPVIHIQQFEKVKESFEEIYNEIIRNGNANKLFLTTCMIRILSLITQEWLPLSWLYNSRRSVRLNYPKVMKVKKYIDDNIFERLKLSDLAAIAGLSTGFLDRIFKEIMGETPINYINRVRIGAVKKMLLETDKSVKVIAYDCGFESEVYFYMLFKKLEGVSPLTFKDHNTF